MASNSNIDPGFQAAPYLGDSSQDPIEFTRRHNMAKFQAEKMRQEQIRENTAAGLKNLMIELKGWEDQEGFKEIMADQDKVLNAFLDMSRKGMNLTSPRNSDEALAFKAITDAHQRIKQKVDTWNEQKGIYDAAQKAIESDATKPTEEQVIDAEKSYKNIQDILKTNDIYGRNGKLQNMLVKRIQFGDVIKKINENKDFFEKPTQVQTVVPNPETGVNETVLTETLTPAQEKENVRRAGVMYDGLDESYKNTVKKMKENDPDPNFKVMSDKDYFATLAVPTYRKKFVEKTTGAGGGTNFNFLGTSAKIVPGELRTNNNVIGGRVYNQRYDFGFPTQKLFKVPTIGGYQHDSDPKDGNDGWHPITGGDYAESELLFYDPTSDELVFRTGQAAQNPWIQNNTTFSVPRKNVPDAEKLPIMVDGKKKELKDILPKEDVNTKKVLPLPKDFWSKTPYIPKK